MRQHDHVELVAGARDAMDAADDFLELRLADELLRGERADGDHELGPQDAQLAIEMRGAARDLVDVGNAIASGLRIASGKAADDRGDVDARAKFFFTDADVLLHPREQPPPRRLRERLRLLDFARA